MCKKHHITFTAILTGMFHLTLGVYIPESSSTSAALPLTSLTPRQVG
ncbi:predicted protein [Sclerotinia sclerotiorum 1980 UF-70]|uniref:Uncharacterized protein n=1 Tax=Sclerotinia sclerotiorum (strain ATCC 18683 / 1980 / Ss-1) TaxID=665079 RepID=A7EVD2_SCLS1|nr:predicted protein [Sclerotinia sclerotiorum 1980 UF-70]EDN93424.1 predicted protein [Sclerotinia sclerotiorum 1980 UF-70]